MKKVNKWIGLLVLVFASCSAKANPAHYSCYAELNNEINTYPTYFVVISPASGDFMLFDEGGVFLNRGVLSRNVSALEPNRSFEAYVGSVHLWFNLVDEQSAIWQLVLFTEGHDPISLYCN